MTNKKKSRTKATKATRAADKKVTRLKQRTNKGRAPKKSAKKKSATNKAGAKKKTLGTKATGGKTVAGGNKQNRSKSQRRNVVAFSRNRSSLHSGEQSGDLQGLSNVEGADSESVQELLEEGNAFEAEVVKGVEDAEDADEGEVRTHEVPQDDVPGEYRDKEE